jgi:hypothetical protein
MVCWAQNAVPQLPQTILPSGTYTADYTTDRQCTKIITASGYDESYLPAVVAGWTLTIRSTGKTIEWTFSGWDGCHSSGSIPSGTVLQFPLAIIDPDDCENGGSYSVVLTGFDADKNLFYFTSSITSFKGNTVSLRGYLK